MFVLVLSGGTWMERMWSDGHEGELKGLPGVWVEMIIGVRAVGMKY